MRASLLAFGVFACGFLGLAVSSITLDPSPNAYGWNNTPVTVEITATSTPPTIYYRVNGGPVMIGSSPVSFTLSSEGVHTVEYRDEDEATFKRALVRIDLTPPTVVIRVPEPGGRYLLHQPVAVDWHVFDNLSGVARVEAPAAPGEALDTRSPGQNRFVVVAQDRAGNETKAGAGYYVHFIIEAVWSTGFYLDRVLPKEEQVKVGKGILRARYPLGSEISIAFVLKDFFGRPYVRAFPELTVLRVEITPEEERLPLRAWMRIPFDGDKGFYFLAYSTRDHQLGFYELQIYFGDGQLERIRIELVPAE